MIDESSDDEVVTLAYPPGNPPFFPPPFHSHAHTHTHTHTYTHTRTHTHQGFVLDMGGVIVAADAGPGEVGEQRVLHPVPIPLDQTGLLAHM